MIRRFFFHIFSLTLILSALALGFWQLERRQWKADLIADIDDKISNAPLMLSKGSEFSSYQSYSIEGWFSFSDSAFVYTAGYFVKPGVTSGAGYWLMVPVKTQLFFENMLVNAGFIPYSALRDKRSSVTAIGNRYLKARIQARPYNNSGFFTAEPQIEDRIVYGFIKNDLDSVFTEKFIQKAYFQLLLPPAQLPELDLTISPEKLQLPDNHLQYAITWLVLALCIFVMYLMLIFKNQGKQNG